RLDVKSWCAVSAIGSSYEATPSYREGSLGRARARGGEARMTQEKVDGWRILAYKDSERVRLVSRNGRDHTPRFHDIAAAVAQLTVRVLVLDGEVAIYDERLRSRFDWLREPDVDAVATPPMFMVFDLLHQDGRELTGRPLHDRRARLENATEGSELVLPVRRL